MISIEDLRITNAAGMVKRKEDVIPLLKTSVTGIVVGSATVEERPGNPEPRFWVAPDGSYALNSLGLPNPGRLYYEKFLPEMVRIANNAGKKLTLSIAGLKQDDWRILAELGASAAVDCIEINLGCPNVWGEGGRKPIVAFDLNAIAKVIEIVRDECGATQRVAAKFSPYWNLDAIERQRHIGSICQYLFDSENVDEVVLSNAEPDAIPPSVNGKPVISMPTAGKSGPYLLENSLEQMRAFGKLLFHRIDKTGTGGISSGRDVLKYVEAGASGVQVGTHFFSYGAKVFSEIMAEYADLAAE